MCYVNKHPLFHRVMSLVLCALLLLGMVPVFANSAPVAHAATTNQLNIVARADYLYNIKWTAQTTCYGWNYGYTFYQGSSYRIPYGQPINSGYYVGFGVDVDTFVKAANTYGSIFYTSRSTYDSTSSLYYATDCSAFVSWCWGTSRKTTYSIPQVSTYLGMATQANTSLLQVGDALNSNDVGHVVLVTDLVYNSSGALTSIEITEQTPPQLKRSYYTPYELGQKYGGYYGIYRYYGTVPAAPDGSSGSVSGSGSSGSTTTGTYYPACDSSQTTFYAAMESIGVSCDWDLHTRIAEANGITDFSGTAEQNEALLALLKAGRLINPDGTSSGGSSSGGTSTTSQYYPACDSSQITFYGAMESIGVSCDWDLHTRIAEANGITDFSGTAEQNEALLALLKAGKLINPDATSSGDSSGGSSGSVGDSVVDGKNGYDRGYAGGMPGTGEYKAFGLDVSSWQGSSLDFNRIKNGGYDYVILRAGTTNGKDELFETYYNRAKAAGLDVGAYYYSYATSVSAVKADMEDFLSYIKGKTFEYPIYFDYEDSTQQALSSSLSQSICLTAMDMLAAEGYLVGMYTGKYFSTQLPMSTICARYEAWIAHYLAVGDGSYNGTYDYTTYGPTYSTQFGMYQFTDSVWVNGYGPYDGDVCYKDYPAIVKKYGFNGYAPEDSSSGDSSGSDSGSSSYIDGCTFYPSHVQIKATEDTYLYTEPRSAKSGNTSEEIEAVKVGDTLTTLGIYQNTGDNIWYQVKASNGETGYIYSGRVEYVKKVYSDIKLSDYDVPNGHVKGNIFNVTGTIKSSYNTIKNVAVSVYSGFGTDGTKVTGGSASVSNNKYTLGGSAVDDATAFNTLSNGNHTYVITADYESYIHDTTKTLKKVSGTRTLKKAYFVVIPSAVSQSSCTHSNSTTVLKAATCTAEGSGLEACSKCGLVTEITIPAAHTYTSTTVPPSGTTDGSITYTCTACGHSYTEVIENYFKKCTFYPSHVVIEVTEATNLYDEPRTEKPGNTSKTLEEAPLGTQYTTTGLYQNAGDNIWYQVTTSTGEVGYIYAGRVKYVKKVYSDIKLTGCTVPNGHVKGESFTVTGTISSTYNTLKKASVTVYSGFGTSGTKVASGSGTVSNNKYVLKSSAIDNAVAFEDLANGKYTYVISVTYESYIHDTTQTLKTVGANRTLNKTYFMVVSSAVDQATCSHSNTETVVTAATCTDTGTSVTACSKCGLTTKNTLAKTSHAYGSYTVTKEATCTEDGSKSKTCADCGKVYTATIAATGHSYTAKVTKAATCTADGVRTYTCSCGDKYTESIPSTGHSYVSGKCSACGASDPNYSDPVVLPSLAGKSFSMSYESEILVNFYYTVSDTTDVAQQGALVFYTNPGTADIAKADDIYADPVFSGDRYGITTTGIAAKDMGDDRYYCAFAKLTDGTYVYSPLYQYSPKKYAMNMLGRASSSAETKALCVVLLNYGAAAQQYFGYKTDDLMNAGLTTEQKALVKAYDASYFKGSVAADDAKVGTFVKTAGFDKKTASLSFASAFSINYYFTPSNAVNGSMKMYVWTPEDYAAAAKLTTSNASEVITMELQSNGSYGGSVTDIPAKNLDETYYVAGIYTDASGNTYCTGIVAYSLSRYCMNNAYGNMGTLAQATAMYGYYAAQLFG